MVEMLSKCVYLTMASSSILDTLRRCEKEFVTNFRSSLSFLILLEDNRFLQAEGGLQKCCAICGSRRIENAEREQYNGELSVCGSVSPREDAGERSNRQVS